MIACRKVPPLTVSAPLVTVKVAAAAGVAKQSSAETTPAASATPRTLALLRFVFLPYASEAGQIKRKSHQEQISGEGRGSTFVVELPLAR